MHSLRVVNRYYLALLFVDVGGYRATNILHFKLLHCADDCIIVCHLFNFLSIGIIDDLYPFAQLLLHPRIHHLADQPFSSTCTSVSRAAACCPSGMLLCVIYEVRAGAVRWRRPHLLSLP
eukprot:29567_5